MEGDKQQSTLFEYSRVIAEPQNDGETGIYRHLSSLDKLVSLPGPGLDTWAEILKKTFQDHPHKPFLGKRVKLEDGSFEKCYTWETYSQVELISKHLGAGMIAKDLGGERAQFKDYDLKFVGVFSKNIREWVLLDIASALYGFTLVPIYDTLGEQAIKAMFKETEMDTLFLTCDHVKEMAQHANQGAFPHLKTFVIMDEENIDDEVISQLEGLDYYTYPQLIEEGQKSPREYAKVKPDDICFFSYTSGTTGRPKGAMLSHKNIAAGVVGIKESIPEFHLIHLSYLPLAHVFERVVYCSTAHKGGQIGFYHGDPLKLTEDLSILKPTLFISVPRIFNKLYSSINAQIASMPAEIIVKVKAAISEKLRIHRETGAFINPQFDETILKKMKMIIGGDVKVCLSGAAPISNDVREFLKVCFSCAFIEGYGQTEGTAGEFISNVEDSTLGHVGGPLPQNELKLVDVPEMKYFSTDLDENGRSAPRGEIFIRGSNVFPGYYKQEEVYNQTVDKDGWLHSGDVGMILPGIHALKIIDRVKNIFKLSQGEYVAPDRLQEIYKTTRGVNDIFIHGEATKSALIAIISTEPISLNKIASEIGVEGTFEELCVNPKINDWFIQELKMKSIEAELKGFERIARIKIDPVTFDKNDLLTTTFKLKRFEARNYYSEDLARLYQDLE